MDSTMLLMPCRPGPSNEPNSFCAPWPASRPPTVRRSKRSAPSVMLPLLFVDLIGRLDRLAHAPFQGLRAVDVVRRFRQAAWREAQLLQLVEVGDVVLVAQR